MVYVLSKEGKPLMSTNRHSKVRHLLKDNKAKIIKKCPFTIQLLYDSTNYTQAECFIFGRRSTGYFYLRTLDNKSIHKSASFKKLKLIETRKSYLTEKRVQGYRIATD